MSDNLPPRIDAPEPTESWGRIERYRSKAPSSSDENLRSQRAFDAAVTQAPVCGDGRKTADNVEALTGWRPPVIYDINSDVFRVATQEDVDRLKRIADASTKLLAQFKCALAEWPPR